MKLIIKSNNKNIIIGAHVHEEIFGDEFGVVFFGLLVDNFLAGFVGSDAPLQPEPFWQHIEPDIE